MLVVAFLTINNSAADQMEGGDAISYLAFVVITPLSLVAYAVLVGMAEFCLRRRFRRG